MSYRSLLALVPILALGCNSQPYTDADRPGVRPLFRETVAQVGDDISELHAREPEFTKREVELARRNVGQPYDLYLLGEAPFETIDAQPVFNLQKSDCVVFVEHTLAMAMSDRFSTFLKNLQRIRYHDGQIGVLTRNHYTEADWNPNNAWFLKDITDDLVGDKAGHYVAKTDRATFFKERYKLATTMPAETTKVSYVPYSELVAIKPKLKSGDIIEFVKGDSPSNAWVHHLGIIAVMPDGAVHVIHSTPPRVREEAIETYVARATKDIIKLDAQKKPRHRGFKFLRPVEDPLAAMRDVDGKLAPRVSVPGTSRMTFDEFVDRVLAGRE
jgi:hypothetical protein